MNLLPVADATRRSLRTRGRLSNSPEDAQTVAGSSGGRPKSFLDASRFPVIAVTAVGHVGVGYIAAFNSDQESPTAAAIADGFRSPGLQARLADLESRKAELERQMETPPPAPVRLHPNLAELYRQRVAALHHALADPATRDEALGLVRGLIEAVALHPADDGFAIEIVGDIAGMVAVANPGSKKAASDCDAALVASSRKVVAGTRNHLNLLVTARCG